MDCQKRINSFIQLIANIMDAHSVALFTRRADRDDNIYLNCFQSLSKNIIDDCCISPGEGIIGWVLREKKNVLASHFDRDAAILKFYKKNEEIKSFIACPLPDGSGVLCADSKKSYFFTEKNEKLFQQLAVIVTDIIESERESEEKNFMEYLLNLTWSLDNLLLCAEKNDFSNKIFSFLSENLRLSHIFFYTANGTLQSFIKEKNGFILRNHGNENFDDNGLLGWTVRNAKRLVIERPFRSGDKTFIVNKNESFGTIAHFIAIPVHDQDGAFTVCAGFIKENNRQWHKKEIDFIEGTMLKIDHFLACTRVCRPKEESIT